MKLLEYVQNIDKGDGLALFGCGLFETLKVNGEHIEVPQLHYARMRRGTGILGLAMPDYVVWLESLQEIVRKEGGKSAYALRVTVSGGGGARSEHPPQWFYQLRPIPYGEKDYAEGIPVVVLSRPRNEHSLLVRIKSTNYMENILAKKEAEASGAREGIWLNTQGFLAEGTMSNLFLIKNGVLHTPSLECGCLPGTRRQLILDCARRLGIPCVEGEYPLDFLEGVEEIFLTNALMGIMPVSSVDGRRIPLQNSLIKMLRKEMDKSFHKPI